MIKRMKRLVLFIALALMSSSNSLAQREGFIPVEGANLKSKIELAVRQGRARQTRF